MVQAFATTPTTARTDQRPAVKGEARLDGLDLWGTLGDWQEEGTREEVVYNVKEKPFMAAIR